MGRKAKKEAKLSRSRASDERWLIARFIFTVQISPIFISSAAALIAATACLMHFWLYVLPTSSQRMDSMGGHVTHAENEIANVKQLVLALNTKIDAILAHHAIKIQQQPQQEMPVAAAVTQPQLAAAVPAGFGAAAAAMDAAATLYPTGIPGGQTQ